LIEAHRSLLRKAGLRCTPARLAVLSHITASGAPRTHAQVADALADRGFDRATIYRNLTELTEAGIFARVELGDHVWRFEMSHSDSGGHPHFLCIVCGTVSCLEDVQVAITSRTDIPAPPARRVGRRAAAAPPNPVGFGSVSSVLLKGTCNRCGEPGSGPPKRRGVATPA